MAAASVVVSLCILFHLVTVNCNMYQTKPYLSFSNAGDLIETTTAAGDHKVKTFVVRCHEDSVEVVIKAHLFDPALPVQPAHLGLGSAGASQEHCRARESASGEYVIRASLSDCGSQVMVGEPLSAE